MSRINKENAEEILASATESLPLIARYADQYIDYAAVCMSLANIAEASRILDIEYDKQYDDTTLTNLKALSNILEAAANLFVACDPYYR